MSHNPSSPRLSADPLEAAAAQAPRLVFGTVVLAEAEYLIVETDDGGHRAERATSCLVRPLPRDRVLLALGDGEAACILAVLRRKDPGVTITAEGDLEIDLPNGAFGVRAPEGIKLLSSRAVEVFARRLGLAAREAEVKLSRLSSVAQAVETVAERIVQRVQRSYRHVEDFEQVRAQRIDMRADEVMHLRARHAMVTAQELVKMDAGQIHVG